MTTTVHESSTPSSVESLKTKNTHNGFIRYVSLVCRFIELFNYKDL